MTENEQTIIEQMKTAYIAMAQTWPEDLARFDFAMTHVYNVVESHFAAQRERDLAPVTEPTKIEHPVEQVELPRLEVNMADMETAELYFSQVSPHNRRRGSFVTSLWRDLICRERQLQEALGKLKAMEWKPITPDTKFGVGKWYDIGWNSGMTISGFAFETLMGSHFQRDGASQHLLEIGRQWFREINPPTPAPKEHL